MPRDVELLIIGAGPFGLALATYAQHLGLDYLVVGQPMDFWKSNMPEGMVLRSACDWHLDPLDLHTIAGYLESQRLTPGDVEPLSRAFYLEYARWFQEQKQLYTVPVLVDRLDYRETRRRPFEATLEDASVIQARNVVLAIGFKFFQNIPPELASILPPGRYGHTGELVDTSSLQYRRCLIIGGRQSAYEWAALAHEQGAAAVDIVHRHQMPAFAPSDWSWTAPMLDRLLQDPGWFRNLTAAEKEGINHRFWAEGRLKLEPWLWPRVNRDGVRIHPETQVVDCARRPDGGMSTLLSTGEALNVDQVILATGYAADINRVPFLSRGNILPSLKQRDGYPVLDQHFQSSVPGLYMTSLLATRDFGLFFAFTVSVRASAKIIGDALE